MTTDTRLAPTDDEIDAAWRESVAKHERTTDFVRDFARAVLAKWGTPAPVEVEPLIPFRHGCKWCGKTTGCKHTPQPIQTQPVAREPLTEVQINAAGKKMAECMDYPWGHMPEQGRAEMRKHAQAVIEVAHGIKGGQP